MNENLELNKDHNLRITIRNASFQKFVFLLVQTFKQSVNLLPIIILQNARYYSIFANINLFTIRNSS